ncbi:MAG: SDR family NAD(P)-dependent oxidoreductase, partial [Gammaproteobacteria bacterium]|nr:SDR family NAD(P)-dependent oxidoreductase [Gammaproteobacteria bacterium]
MSVRANPTSVVITGATGAIGGALAERYAAPGVRLTLHGRKLDVLTALAARCEAAGAQVLVQAGDVRDRDSYRAWLTALCLAEAPDLVLLTAGLNTHVGPDGELEDWASVEALLDVNVWAVMATVDAVLPAMRRRGAGQIALFSSLAAYHGLALTPSYSASKAAIKAYGEALRGLLAPSGIAV